MLTCSVLTFPATNANAAVKINSDSNVNEINIEPEDTAYNWTVQNLGVSNYGKSQIKGPLSNGYFDTESILFGSSTHFKVTWSGASANAKFSIEAVGKYNGNSKLKMDSDMCSGKSGSVSFYIPYEDSGYIALYVNSFTHAAINIGKLNVDSRY